MELSETAYMRIKDLLPKQGISAVSLDSTAVKVHPDAHGAVKKRRTGDREDARRVEHEDSLAGRKRQAGCGLPLSPGNAPDATEGRLLLDTIGPLEASVMLLMDRAYEDDRTRRTA